MNVKQILNRKGCEVVTIRPDQPAQDVVRVMNRRKIGAIVVVTERGEVAGIISERDMIRALESWGAESLRMPLSRLCSAPVVGCSPETSIQDIMTLMTERRVRHVPVIQNGRLQGIISIGDVVKELLQESEHQINSLKDYLYS